MKGVEEEFLHMLVIYRFKFKFKVLFFIIKEINSYVSLINSNIINTSLVGSI